MRMSLKKNILTKSVQMKTALKTTVLTGISILVNLVEDANSIKKKICLYSHDNPKNHEDKRYEEIEKKLLTLQHEYQNNAKTFSDFAKKMEKKLESMEQKNDLQRQTLADKEGQIKSLEKKVENKIKETEVKFKCSKCNFSSNSESGLKTHITKKHTILQEAVPDKFPNPCILCDKMLKDKTEARKHLRTHSYKLVQFKCEICDFIGSEEIDMEVHNAKTHGEKAECGICDYEAKDLTDLETHLSTCEFYECTTCDKKILLFTNIKEHFLTMHEDILQRNNGGGIRQYKASRENNDIYKSKYHTVKSLFPELSEK